MPEGLQTLPEIAWCVTADGLFLVGNDRWSAVTGLAGTLFSSADWLQAIHVEDRPAASDAWSHGIASAEPFEAVFRLCRADGGHCWVVARVAPIRDDAGVVLYWTGVATDIDAVKTSEARSALIATELAHRIGNIFAVVGSMLALSARGQPEVAAFARATAARITSLGAAHAFIWPMDAGRDAAPPALTGLLGVLLDAYVTPDGPKIDVCGDNVPISAALASCVTLIVHELATNAAKHGALTSRDGHIAVRIRHSATGLMILWAERGGPAIDHRPTRTGFGTGMIDRIIRLTHGARARRWWRREGLMIALRFPLEGERQSPPSR